MQLVSRMTIQSCYIQISKLHSFFLLGMYGCLEEQKQAFAGPFSGFTYYKKRHSLIIDLYSKVAQG